MTTIHPGMRNWEDVAGWAESNTHMAQAIRECKERSILGLPYGRGGVDQRYISEGLIADLAPDDDLRRSQFPYLDAADVKAAYVTAEVYRLMEAGQVRDALDLAVAHLFVARQYCDREMQVEKTRSVQVLIDALANLRDVFYKYRESISQQQLTRIAVAEIPFLRPDRNHLFMPEGDRWVAEVLIRSVYRDDQPDEVDPRKLADTFAAVQAREAPLTRFGAARRWEHVGYSAHGSLTASLERLRLVYDDWWRRWRVQEYDPILSIQTQFERTNKVRYAAVIYAMRDLADLFNLRRELIVAVNGTALSAGICAYHNYYGEYPTFISMIYGQFARKISDLDAYDRQFGALIYLLRDSRVSIDAPAGRIWLEPNVGILYSKGQNHSDDVGQRHTDDGRVGDIVLWPPIKAISREQGLLH